MPARIVSTLVPEPAPIVKWAGGKTQLLNRIVPRLPQRWNRYYEPFAGGAALYFAVRPRDAVLCDTNGELVNTYNVTRENVDALIRSLSRHRYDKDRFYQVRAQHPADLDAVQRASRFLYLNRTCFNGLYRVNRRGEFNVPFGRYTNPRICDAPKLRAASRVLAQTQVVRTDFMSGVDSARRGDFVYFDPPYVPLSHTASFTSYTSAPFGRAEHERLAATFAMLDKRGCKVMLSNSDTPLVNELFRGYRIDKVAAMRNINSRGGSRGAVMEVLVRNY